MEINTQTHTHTQEFSSLPFPLLSPQRAVAFLFTVIDVVIVVVSFYFLFCSHLQNQKKKLRKSGHWMDS